MLDCWRWIDSQLPALSKVKRGQDAIKYGLIGLVVALLAYAIVAFVSMAIS
jgi:hypothetical protein